MEILLVGRTGHGKSSTGNSILMRGHAGAFIEGDGATSVTREVSVGETKWRGETVRVIDTPGLCDTREMGAQERMGAVIEWMEAGMSAVQRGVSCMLLVLNYCSPRLTDEEMCTVRLLQQIFSTAMFRKFVIVVFTHTDVFRRRQRQARSQISLEEWCHAQTDDNLRHVLSLCNFRCIGFDNFTPTNYQRTKLFTLISRMNPDREIYTREMFDSGAMRLQRRFLGESENVKGIDSTVKDLLNTFKEQTGEMNDVTEYLINLDEAKQNAEHLLDELLKLRYSENTLNEIIANVKSFIENVNTGIRFAELIALQEDRTTALMRVGISTAVSVIPPTAISGTMAILRNLNVNLFDKGSSKHEEEKAQDKLYASGMNTLKKPETSNNNKQDDEHDGASKLGDDSSVITVNNGIKLEATKSNTEDTGKKYVESLSRKIVEHFTNCVTSKFKVLERESKRGSSPAEDKLDDDFSKQIAKGIFYIIKAAVKRSSENIAENSTLPEDPGQELPTTQTYTAIIEQLCKSFTDQFAKNTSDEEKISLYKKTIELVSDKNNFKLREEMAQQIAKSIVYNRTGSELPKTSDFSKLDDGYLDDISDASTVKKEDETNTFPATLTQEQKQLAVNKYKDNSQPVKDNKSSLQIERHRSRKGSTTNRDNSSLNIIASKLVSHMKDPLIPLTAGLGAICLGGPMGLAAMTFLGSPAYIASGIPLAVQYSLDNKNRLNRDYKRKQARKEREAIERPSYLAKFVIKDELIDGECSKKSVSFKISTGS